jgi:cytochrome P450
VENPFAAEAREDPYPIYRRMREAAAAHDTAFGVPAYLRYADCGAILRDGRWGRGSGSDRLRGAEDKGNRRSFVRQDPPEHTRLRGLVSKAFSPQIIASMRPRIEQLADGLVDDMLATDGEVELLASYAYRIPVTVICEMLGVPAEDQATFSRWARSLARGQDPEEELSPEEVRRRNGAIRNFREYFRELIAKRRTETTTDVLGRLIEAREAGDSLSDADLLATCVLLLFAGHETTVSLISNGILALLRHPDQLARVRDGDLPEQSSFIDELVRYDAPVHFVSRTALEDLEHGGRRFAKGNHVLLVLAAANRDPEAFEDPERLDVARVNSRHLAFGLGIHFCLGAQLARLEGEIAIRTLLRRAPAMALTPEPLTYKPNIIMRGLQRLPVRLN